MNYQQKSSRITQHQVLERVSSFITRFHAALLPKANDSGVYRDLSEEQQYLLTNLDNDSPLHSILAGCLAIDSCLSTISQSQQSLTNKILKSVTILCSTWQNIQNQLIYSVKNDTISVQKIEQLMKEVQITTKTLLSHCYELPYSEDHEEIIKYEKILSQQYISFKFGDIKGPNKAQDVELKPLKEENLRLKQELSKAQKQSDILKLKINTNTAHEREFQTLKEQVSIYEKNIAILREQFKREKKGMLREIRRLEEELRAAEENSDNELAKLLEQLEDQIESLKQQRRHDERIINQIQQKLEGMSISKQSRIRSGLRKQSRIDLKYSHILRSKNYRQTSQSDTESRSPEFRNYQSRGRFYTINVEDTSKSTPKINQGYSYKNKYLRNLKERPYIRDQQIKENQRLKYTKLMPNQQFNNSPQLNANFGNIYKPKQSKVFQQRDLYTVPMIESKTDSENFKSPNQKNINHTETKKSYNQISRKLILPQQNIRIKNDYNFEDQQYSPMATGRTCKYNPQIEKGSNGILQNRYKTSRN